MNQANSDHNNLSMTENPVPDSPSHQEQRRSNYSNYLTFAPPERTVRNFEPNSPGILNKQRSCQEAYNLQTVGRFTNSKDDIEEVENIEVKTPQRQSAITLGELKARALIDDASDPYSIPNLAVGLRRSVSGNHTNKMAELKQESPVHLYLSPPNGPMYLNLDNPSDGFGNRLSNSTKWSVTGKDTERVFREERDSVALGNGSIGNVDLITPEKPETRGMASIRKLLKKFNKKSQVRQTDSR